jgi:hypothetical protein
VHCTGIYRSAAAPLGTTFGHSILHFAMLNFEADCNKKLSPSAKTGSVWCAGFSACFISSF